MIDHLDHLVLTTTDEAACLRFYVDGLGMTLERFGADRKALRFGNQKINVHVKGHEFEPRAHLPVPGALDLCFIASVPLDEVVARLRGLNEIAERRGQTLAQLALTWVLRDERMTSALIGASSVRQLEENVAALAAPRLTAEEIAEIDTFAVSTPGTNIWAGRS